MHSVFRRACLALVFGAAPLPAATLYQHATLLTLAAGADTAIADGFMLVADDGTIAALGAGGGDASPAVVAAQKSPGFATIDLQGKIVMPGFVSGHSHLWQSAFRGITPGSELPAWLDALHYTYGGFFGPGDFGAFTRHGAYDQLRHGVTTTYNHSHFIGRSFENYQEQLTAELTVPQRFIFSWVNDPSADDATWRARLKPVLAQVEPRADHALLGVAINAIGIFREPGYLTRELALAK